MMRKAQTHWLPNLSSLEANPAKSCCSFPQDEDKSGATLGPALEGPRTPDSLLSAFVFCGSSCACIKAIFGEDGMNWEIGIDIYTLICIK